MRNVFGHIGLLQSSVAPNEEADGANATAAPKQTWCWVWLGDRLQTCGRHGWNVLFLKSEPLQRALHACPQNPAYAHKHARFFTGFMDHLAS